MPNFADVVALVPGDPTKSTFTYSFQDISVEVGCLVMVPYGKKLVEGIVLRLHNDRPEFETKPISSLVFEKPVLPSHLIATAKWMSQYYHEPLRSCVETVLLFRKKVRLGKESLLTENIVSERPVLYEEQQHAYESIVRSINLFSSFLLFGITGSGKTEIYLRVMEDVISQGKQVIYLVPEIALTPQTIARVESRFPGKTSIINSQISEGSRYRTFINCLSGERPIIIGSRSALFAPFPNLGLIIIDEAHDQSYKQDASPHYNAVTTAESMAQSLSIPLVLGSATPRVVDFYFHQRDLSDNNILLELKNRALNASLPTITVVDMREELKKRNFSTLSDALEDGLRSTLEKKEQALLFLNKRGIASSFMCRACGWTAECPRCSVALTLHSELYGALHNKLVCHHCDFTQSVVPQCPACSSLYVKALGSGTERVEGDLKKLFPHARVLRMDKDTTTRKGSHEDIYRSFVNNDADILIGTQMITKGWDIPNVTFVGIVNADTALHMPNYKSAEQTFDLITQVSGRAGRSTKSGRVVLQTYNPDHYAVIAAARHSFQEFYETELRFRQQLNYPPFSHLAQLVYADIKEERALLRAELLARQLRERVASENYGAAQVEILGPSTCLLPKLRNKWYYQILLKGEKGVIDQLLELIPRDWKINVDPENAV